MKQDANSILSRNGDGFTSKFDRWNQLPLELKIKILRYLPFETMRNFVFLSRECYSLASCAQTEVNVIYFKELDYDLPKNAIRKARMALHIDSKYLLLFKEEESDKCCVARINNKRGRVPSEPLDLVIGFHEEPWQPVAMRTLFQMSRILRTKYLTVSMSNLSAETEQVLEEKAPGPAFNCKNFCVYTQDVKILKLLRYVCPGSKIRINPGLVEQPLHFNTDSTVFDLDAVKAAPSIDISGISEVTDDQLVKLQASRIFMKTPEISSKGINRLILQWLDGKRRIVSIVLIETRGLNVNSLLEDVDPSYLIPKKELIKKNSIIRELGQETYPGFLAGIRNKSGSLIIVNASSNEYINDVQKYNKELIQPRVLGTDKVPAAYRKLYVDDTV